MTEEKTPSTKLHATGQLLAAAALVAATVAAVQFTNSGVSALVAGHTFPAGLGIIRKQIPHLWPQLAALLKITTP